MKRIVSILLLIALMSMSLCGCSLFDSLIQDQPDPETTAQATQSVEQMIDRCAAACNNVDVDGILDCVSPKIAKPVRTMMNLVSAMSDLSEEDLLETIIGLLGAEETEDATQVCKTLAVEVQSVNVNGDKATADLDFTFEQGGARYTGDTTISCICVDGRWYISMLCA